MKKFSVGLPVYSELTPVQAGASGQTHWRGRTVQRAIKSVMNQQFPDWELIIVNDGCVDDITPKILNAFADMDKRIKIIHNETNQGRSHARNQAMEQADAEWLCWLDSDDEYSTNYLRQLDKATEVYPKSKLFNFGSIIHWPDLKTTVREPFRPELNATKTGHEWFRSGHIGAGSFIFKKKLWEKKKYRIPDTPSPYQFAADSKIPLKLDPEKDKFQYDNTIEPKTAFQDGVLRHGLSLGNPFGDDYAQFYYLTRDNVSIPLDMYLYIQYPRSSEDDYKYFGDVFDTSHD